MKLTEAKVAVEVAEGELSQNVFCEACRFNRDGRSLIVCLTERLRKQAKKGRVWKSSHFLMALKNAAYGFESDHQRSKGGRDGIFLVDRDHRPKNEMQKKLFDRFIDKSDSGIIEIAEELGVCADSLLPVRLVSHHMRLLGVMSVGDGVDTLVLIDYDNS